MISSISTSQLEYLVAVVESESWKQAAENLGVTPSALSQGIAEIERKLGLTLFERHGRTRRPTQQGLIATEHARLIVAQLNELTRWAQSNRDGSGGTVKIGMIDTAAVHHFRQTLLRFRQQRTDVELHLSVQPSSVLLSRLSDGELDLVIAVNPPKMSEALSHKALLIEPLYAYGPPVSLLAKPDWGPWVGFPKASHSRSAIELALRQQAITYEVVAESSQPAVLKEMVHLGLGWCVLTASDAECEPRPLLRAQPNPIASRSLVLVTRKQSRLPVVCTELATQIELDAAKSTFAAV